MPTRRGGSKKRKTNKMRRRRGGANAEAPAPNAGAPAPNAGAMQSAEETALLNAAISYTGPEINKDSLLAAAKAYAASVPSP